MIEANAWVKIKISIFENRLLSLCLIRKKKILTEHSVL